MVFSSISRCRLPANAGSRRNSGSGRRRAGCRRSGFADRLAVIDGFGVGQQFEILFEAVGDLEQDVGTGGGIGLAPGREGSVGGVEGQFDILGGGAGGLGASCR